MREREMPFVNSALLHRLQHFRTVSSFLHKRHLAIRQALYLCDQCKVWLTLPLVPGPWFLFSQRTLTDGVLTAFSSVLTIGPTLESNFGTIWS